MSFNRHENRLVRSESQANIDWAAPESRQSVQRVAPVKVRMRPAQRAPFTVVDLYHAVRLPLAGVLCVVAVIMWASL